MQLSVGKYAAPTTLVNANEHGIHAFKLCVLRFLGQNYEQLVDTCGRLNVSVVMFGE